jgi:cbb3-type cytochrome oxidase subunit 3
MLIDKIQGDYVNMISFIGSIALVLLSMVVMAGSVILVNKKKR